MELLKRDWRKVIQEPFTIEQLSQKIREVLSSRQYQTG